MTQDENISKARNVLINEMSVKDKLIHNLMIRVVMPRISKEHEVLKTDMALMEC